MEIKNRFQEIVVIGLVSIVAVFCVIADIIYHKFTAKNLMDYDEELNFPLNKRQIKNHGNNSVSKKRS